MKLPATLVKVCSLRETEDAEFAIAAGADAVGLIFAEARRRVTLERAVEIVAEVRRLQGDSRVLVVGVFVDQSVEDVNRIAERAALDLVQLHGAERPAYVQAIERPVIKVVRPSVGEITSTIAPYAALARPPVSYLVDGASRGHAGGTGQPADWGRASDLACVTKVILAGGLNPENVGAAIRAVRPFGVDVSSGVETDGAKDRQKVIAFVAAARRSFSELDLSEGWVVPVAKAAEPAHRAQARPRGGGHAHDDGIR